MECCFIISLQGDSIGLKNIRKRFEGYFFFLLEGGNLKIILIYCTILLNEKLTWGFLLLFQADLIYLVIITSELSKRSFFWMYMVEVSGNLARSDRPVFVSLLSLQLRVMILIQNPNDAHFSKLWLIKFSNLILNCEIIRFLFANSGDRDSWEGMEP